MLTLLVGALAVLVGVLLGFTLGKSTSRSGAAALRDQRDALERDRDSQQTALEALRAQINTLTGELGRAQAGLAAEKEKYAQMQADLNSTFGHLAAQALRANNESFLALATQQLGGQTTQAALTLEAKEQAIKAMLDPVAAALKSLDEQARGMEEKRAGAYGEIKTLVEGIGKAIPESLQSLRNETSQLITALRAPKTRGNWGEAQLKRCVEWAGMVEHCSFTEQVTARDENDNILRPDLTIQLPNGREIVVDAKTPLDAFLEAGDGADAAAQAVRFAAHAQRVKAHLKELSGKAYWKQFERAPDFVVCFLPSEALFSAALEADPSLIEFSAQNHVVMATPTTLIALLRAVEFGWQQTKITENAKAIHELGSRIYEKLVVAQGHVTKMGSALSSSVDAYNKLLGSIEGKGGVFFCGRQLGELVHAESDLDEAVKLQAGGRAMESPEWSQPLLAVHPGEDESRALED